MKWETNVWRREARKPKIVSKDEEIFPSSDETEQESKWQEANNQYQKWQSDITTDVQMLNS